MSAPITYTSNAHEIINSIVTRLFAYQTARHQRCIDKIATIGSIGGGAFMHRAQTFRPSWAMPRMARTPLQTHAWPSMDLFMKDKEIVDNDSKAIWQMLFTMIVQCTSLQEVRDTLPDFLVELFPELSVLPRIQPEAWTILDQSRTYRQYLKLREKIELYTKLETHPQLGKLMSFYHFED